MTSLIIGGRMNIKGFWIKIFLFFVFIVNVFPQENDIENEIRGIIITKAFGSFSIPKDWVEVTRYSRNGKYFYSHNSESISSRMTNIFVKIGTNPYALEDHMTFRYAILRQMLMQASNAEVSGDGTFTEYDDPLYIFTIEDKEEKVTTIQYYIIGNKKHILVHLTDFHNENIANANEVAKFIVNSFVWPE
jgi:hypothetical protein